MMELGAGGGQGDLDQHHELETSDPNVLGSLISLITSKLQERRRGSATATGIVHESGYKAQAKDLDAVLDLLVSIMTKGVHSISLDGCGMIDESAADAEDTDFAMVNELPLERVIPALTNIVSRSKQKAAQKENGPKRTFSLADSEGLPKRIVKTTGNPRGFERDADYMTDVPILSTFFLLGTLRPYRPVQAKIHTPMHCGLRQLDCGIVNGLSVWPFVRWRTGTIVQP
jgi:hypothetical protein